MHDVLARLHANSQDWGRWRWAYWIVAPWLALAAWGATRERGRGLVYAVAVALALPVLLFQSATVAAITGNGAPDDTDAETAVAVDEDPRDEDDEDDASEAPAASGTPEPGPDETTPTPTRAPSPTPTETSLARPAGVPDDAQPAVVERIVDGDTMWVRVDQQDSGPLAAGATHKVRLLEYDSPESTTSTECFGPEATDRLASLTPVGSEVWLEADREDTDRYDRYLRYVWLADGTMVNLVMVREGFGEAVLYEPNDRHIDTLRAAEDQARVADAGMWGAPCDYDAPPPPAPETDSDGTDGQPPPEETSSNPWGSDSCDPAYDPCVPPKSEVGDLNCPDIKEKYPNGVEVDHAHGDPHGLDRDEDGHGCES